MMVNKIVHEILLDVSNNNIQETFYIQQGDARTHKLAMHLNQNGKAIDLTGCTAYIRAMKPDNTEIYSKCKIDRDIAYYTVTNQFSAITGYVTCWLEIIGSEDTMLYSPLFQANVNTTKPLTNIESSNEYTAFEETMVEANELIQSVQAAATDSANSAAEALDSANNAASSTAAAKIYAETAAGHADNANMYSTTALAAKEATEQAEAAAASAKTDAETARDTALLYKNSAANSATDASFYLAATNQAANNASSAATNAALSETAANNSAVAAASSEAATQVYATTSEEKANICTQKAEELTNRIIAQSVYETSTNLTEGIYFVRLGE